MGIRGRKSSSDLAVFNSPIEAVQRPDAPYDLTDEQAAEWVAIVNTMPADHFMRGNYPLLAQLCRHVVAARRVAQLIEQATAGKDLDKKEFVELLQEQRSESISIQNLLRSMRLTQQSVMRHETTRHPKRVKNPWDPE